MSKADISLNKLIQNLQKLEPKLNKSIVNLGVKAGAKTVQQAAINNVPSSLDDGKHSKDKVHSASDLKDGIKIKKKTKGANSRDGDSKSVTAFQVGINLKGGKAWFAHLFEFGSIIHAPVPFMTPAYEQNGRTAINATKNYMIKRFDKAVKKGLIK